MNKRDFSGVNRIVVKVGSSTLSHATGKLNLHRMEQLVRELADLRNQGKEVVLVSSGAQAAGIGRLGLSRKPKTIPEKQATAAVGQGILMHMYEKLFAEYGVIVAQVLLTREDMSDRRRFLNARNALNALLDYHAVPVINENDTIAIDEIKFGDNDTLSAMVAGLIDADLLIILSDIDGLFSANPQVDPEAVLIGEVNEITSEIEQLAGGAGSNLGTGGMATKLLAGRIAANSGYPMVIANGRKTGIIRRVAAGEPLGTLFLPRVNRLQAKKKWIAFGSSIQGKIIVDSGAGKALLERGKSLLPSGVVEVEGTFGIGNTVSVVCSGEEIARGIVNYPSDEIVKIRGKKTSEIEKILGHKDYDEIVHRDNLVLSLH